MRILMLCSRVPYPLRDGGNLAVSNMIEGLLDNGVTLSLLSMNTTRHWVNYSSLPPLFNRLEELHLIQVDNRIKPWNATVSLLKGGSYNLERFITPSFRNRLIHLLVNNEYDCILLEGLFVTPYIDTIKSITSAKVCYRQHNVEFEIWERLANNCKNFLKRIYLNRLAAALKKYELNQLNSYDGIAAISPIDKETYTKLGCTLPIIVTPYSLKNNQLEHKQSTFEPPLKFYHIGAMDWQPNVDAINWFLSEVWPQVLKKSPESELYLAGRNMPEYYIQNKWKNVIVVGEVSDAKHFESDKNVLIVPINAGGGLRIKILEAMAASKAIVSTKIGLQGISFAKNNENVLIADSSEHFANACIQLANNPEIAKTIGQNAQAVVQSNYSQSVVIKNFIQFISQLIQK